MTVCCESRKSPVSAHRGSSPGSLHPFTVDTRQGVCKRFRSTKGASKARRDHINGEIRNMRALLPIPQEDQERLSYLHAMAGICTFIRKAVLFQGLPAGQGSDSSLPYDAFLHALHGFILVITKEGRLVYVSENVSEYLGHSMVDVLQGDSLYDMVESQDIDTVKCNLEMDNTSLTERSFVCHMHTSKAFRLQQGSCCSMLVRGRWQAVPQSSLFCPIEGQVFVALCTPTVNRLPSSKSPCFSQSFTSVHRLDMTFTQLSDSVLFYLGYSVEEMIGHSWYSLLHPDDLSLSACSHKSLLQADLSSQIEMVMRLQCKDLNWTWIYTHATKDSANQVSCTNFIIRETEATFLLQKIHTNAFSLSPQAYCPSPISHLPQTQGNGPTRVKRQQESNNQSEEPRVKASRSSDSSVYYVPCSSQDGGSPVNLGESPTFLSTPPYSPASSLSSTLQEDTSSDFLLDVCGYTEHLLGPPDSSPPYYHCHRAGPPSHLSPSGPLQTVSEQTFDQGALSMTNVHSPDSCPSPPNDFPACTADARLVPDCLPMSDMCENSADCVLHPEDFSLTVQLQGGSLHIPQGVTPMHEGLLTPNSSPTTEVSFQYSEREKVEISILAQQISSLASSFDMYHTLSPVQNIPLPSSETLPSACDWPLPPAHSPVHPLKPELVLDEGVFDSILKDLDMVSEKEDTPCRPLSYCYQPGLCRLAVTQPSQDSSIVQSSALTLSTLVDSSAVHISQHHPGSLYTEVRMQ